MNRKPNKHHDDQLAIAPGKVRNVACTIVMLYAIAAPAIAGTFDNAMGSVNYVTMTGDINNDGQNDVLMNAFPKVVTVPLDDDLDIALAIPPRSPTFLLLSTGYGTYSLVSNPDSKTTGWTGWAKGTQKLTYGGPSGGFASSLTIAAATPEQASFVVSMAADTGLLSITGTTAPSVNTGSGGSTSSSTENYTYDALGRLRKLVYPSGIQVTYEYDGAGNRKSSSIGNSASSPPPSAQGMFGYVGNSGHSSNGVSGDLITFTIKNTGGGTITSVTATCGGGSFHSMGSFSAPTLAPGTTGTIQCRAAASGAYSAAKVTMSGVNAYNNGVSFGPY